MSLTTSLRLALTATLKRAADLSQPIDPLRMSLNADLADGSDEYEADQLWHDTRTLAAEAEEVLDLAGVLTNNVGETVDFAAIKVLLISTIGKGNADAVHIGPGASNGWLGPWADASDRLAIAPESYALLVNAGEGWAVTAGTGDALALSNAEGAAAVSFDLVLIGVNT